MSGEGPSSRAAVVREGTFVALDTGDGLRVVAVKENARLRIGKKSLNIGCLIGVPYGTAFQVSSHGDLERETERRVEKETGAQQRAEQNNSTLVDDNRSQKLTIEEIEKLKQTGGEAVIEALMENSATFANKTAFSQAKYLKKKKQKYMMRVVVRRPTARVICESAFQQDPRRICNIRIEALTLGLSQAGVAANARVLVVDATSGMLTGAVLERLGGTGTVTSLLPARKSGSLEFVKQFNLPEGSYDTLRSCMLGDVLALEGRLEKEGREPSVHPDGEAKPRAPKAILRATMEEMETRMAQGFTSLLVATPTVSLPHLVPRLVRYLRPGSPFVVFSQAAQELGETLTKLTEGRLAACMTLSETWYREHQVLPFRTHPHMNHSGTGGYTLTGQRVTSDEEVPRTGETGKRDGGEGGGTGGVGEGERGVEGEGKKGVEGEGQGKKEGVDVGEKRGGDDLAGEQGDAKRQRNE